MFLASAASDYVHGTILPVDGGWLARWPLPKGEALRLSAGISPERADKSVGESGTTPWMIPGDKDRGDLPNYSAIRQRRRPAKIALSITACTPTLPSATWVTPKSTASDIRLSASSSARP